MELLKNIKKTLQFIALIEIVVLIIYLINLKLKNRILNIILYTILIVCNGIVTLFLKNIVTGIIAIVLIVCLIIYLVMLKYEKEVLDALEDED